jgi:hypothetical protein
MYILRIIITTLILATSLMLSTPCSERHSAADLETDSVRAVDGVAVPENTHCISAKFDRMATVSREADTSHLSVIDVEGRLLYSTSLGPGAAFCDLICNGNKVFINRIITERLHVAEVYNVTEREKTLSFECPFYISPSPGGKYFYAWYFSGFSDIPWVYDSSGQVLGEIEHDIPVWNMLAIDDSTLLFAEGNIVKIISVPDLKAIEQYEFDALYKPSLEVRLSLSPDGTVFGIYTPDSIVIYDRIEKREFVLAGSHPEFGGGDEIVITDRGKYVVSLTWGSDRRALAYNLFEKTALGYESKAAFESLPYAGNLVSLADCDTETYGDRVLAYCIARFGEDGKPIRQFPSCCIDLNYGRQDKRFVIGSEGLLIPVAGEGGEIISVSFGNSPKSAITLEYKRY